MMATPIIVTFIVNKNKMKKINLFSKFSTYGKLRKST